MMKKITLIIPLFLTAVINGLIFINYYSHWLILAWLLSIIAIILSSLHLPIRLQIKNISWYKIIFILIVICLPIFVRLYFINPVRIHQDEFITGYLSAHYDFRTYNFFSAIPQNKVDWQNQFPTPYFALQKIFFLLWGESPTILKFSTLPYVFIVSLMLYLITKLIVDKKTAVLSVIIYAFFAASVYLETWSLHFISSTAFFLIFFYFILLQFKHNSSFYSVLAGIFCGLCYLFYFSSYIALPFLILIFIWQFIARRSFLILRNLLYSLVAFAVVLSPFLTYNFKTNNYMPVRFRQVSFTNQVKDNSQTPFVVIKNNLINATKSMYEDGLGGCGGYTFGHLSFFDRFSLSWFLLGLTIMIIIMKKNVLFLFVISVIVIAFLGSMGLTMPPPPYHRFSIAYPFIAIILSLPFYMIMKIINRNYLKYFLTAGFLLIFILTNYFHFKKAIASDEIIQIEDKERLTIMHFVDSNYPQRKLYVASFPSYSFEKVYYFFNPNRVIETDYHANLLKKFNTQEKYIYIIIFPEVFDTQFKQADPNGKIIDSLSKNYHLFIN